MGRASSYTSAAADEICERLANGEPLRQICRDERMPAWRTVYDWVDADSDFAARIARARQVGFDAIAEHALEIADTPVEGVRREDSDDGYKEVREDMLGHRKLQVETRLKLLAKWCPTKYGEATRVDVGNADGKPFQVDDSATAARLAAIIAAAQHRKDHDGSDLV